MRNPIALFRRARRGEPDFADEIAAHLALEEDRLVKEGWRRADAAEEARRRFGNVTRVRERYHDARHVPWLEDGMRDVAYAVRTLAKDKGYVLGAVAALGLGLAANIAVFSVFSAVVLHPLAVPSPARLASVYQVTPHARFGTFSLADYFFYKENSRTLTSVAASQPSHLRLAAVIPVGGSAAAGIVAEPLIASFVTANYFDTYQIRPAAGRSIGPEDEDAAGVYAGMLSDNFWERRFGRDTSIIGSTLLLSGIHVRVVGISARNFAGVRQEIPDVWITLAALGPLRARADRETTACCEVIARLANGATLAQAQAELESLADLRRRTLPAGQQRMSVQVLQAVPYGIIGRAVRPLFIALQVAMLLVLLIACANVTGLLLGRAAARRREIAVRLAIGAGRFRLIRQFLAEGVVVAVIAGAIAAAVTGYGLAAAERLVSATLSRQGGGTMFLAVTPDARVLLYVAAVSILAGVGFSLAPALQASRVNLVSALKSSLGGLTAAAGHRIRGWLIAAQVAVSVALLIAAAGLARASARLLAIDPGFRPTAVLSVWLTNPEEIGLTPLRAREVEAEVRDRLAATPGVQLVSVASRLPLGGNVSTTTLLPAERTGDAGAYESALRIPYAFVTERYFEALRIPILLGRTFSAQEVRDSAQVVVVSDSLARRLWPQQNPIGKLLALGVVTETGVNFGPGPNGVAEVIGVVGNVHSGSIGLADPGDVYLPRATHGWSSRVLVRATGDVTGLRSSIPRLVHDVEPALPVQVETMDEIVSSDAGIVTGRVAGRILSIVGVLGLLLAAVGGYGMVSYTVRQQQREIGIRMALGARTSQVLTSALRGTVTWIARGAVVGIPLGAAGILGSGAVLAGAVAVRPFDPLVLTGVPLLILVVAVTAAVLSGRKAARFDPAAVLRVDG